MSTSRPSPRPAGTMSPHLRFCAALLLAQPLACVHVPDSIKQEFRAAEPDERSNYQPGYHGTAPAADASDPWSRYGSIGASADAGVEAPGPSSPDAGAAVVMPAPQEDGGTP